jgi:acylpyruvate hydrolase
MRFMRFHSDGSEGLALEVGDGRWAGLTSGDAAFPGFIGQLLAQGGDALKRAAEHLRRGPEIDIGAVDVLPPLRHPPKIICVGLNYADHTSESPYAQPDYPTLFGRFNSSLIGHGQPIVRPLVSDQLDYEGELVAVIGSGGRHIAKARALDHVAGWSVFNDASIRDYQFKTPQWTVGKNFDNTGAFGPTFVTADELPSGAVGLALETRLNGAVVQAASTRDMIFDVATLISTLSEAITLEPGDLIVTGTPAGVGFGRKPQLWMKPGDIVEVEVEGLGVLRNPVVDAPIVKQATLPCLSAMTIDAL